MITRTIFTTEEATDHFGEYLPSLCRMGLAKGFAGYRDVYYYGVEVEAALNQIEEFKENEAEEVKYCLECHEPTPIQLRANSTDEWFCHIGHITTTEEMEADNAK